jgi:hypothetical protein
VPDVDNFDGIFGLKYAIENLETVALDDLRTTPGMRVTSAASGCLRTNSIAA